MIHPAGTATFEVSGGRVAARAGAGPAGPPGGGHLTHRVGPWELLEPLGRGGMGEVWLARDSAGRKVALKLLPADEVDPTAVARFRREGEVLLALRHPRIVPCLAAELSGPRPWIALELQPGGSLLDLVRREGPLPLRLAVELVIELCDAVQAAHLAGIVHRDLKPSNVLLGSDGAPRLADLGLARLLRPGARLSATGMILGSPGYLAPEQVLGGEIGPATDVWGLGAVLFHLLTGVAPHARGTTLSALRATLSEPAWPPSQLRPEVDPALDAVVLRCLASAPAERYPTAAAVGAGLRGWLRDAQQGPPPPRSRRGAAPWIAATALLAGGLAVSGWVLLRRDRAGAGPSLPTPPVSPPVPAAEASSSVLEPAVQAEADQVQALLDAAREEIGRGALEAALRLQTRALEVQPDAVPALVDRAFLQRMLGDHPAAIADATRALELDPQQVDALHARALCLTEAGRPHEALPDLTRAVGLAPTRPELRVSRSALLLQLGRRAEARQELDRVLELQPEEVGAYLHRGHLREAEDDLQGALADYQRVIDLAPHQAGGWHGRGIVRQRLGLIEGAIADYERFLELVPTGHSANEIRRVLAHLRGAR